MWTTYRCFAAKGMERIPLFGHLGLAPQLGCVEYSRPRRFRATLQSGLSLPTLSGPNAQRPFQRTAGTFLLVRDDRGRDPIAALAAQPSNHSISFEHEGSLAPWPEPSTTAFHFPFCERAA